MKIKKNWLQVDAVDFSRLRELLQFVFIYRLLSKALWFSFSFARGWTWGGTQE